MNKMPFETYVLGDYLITYEPNIVVEKFSCQWYDGIVFIMKDGRYQLVNNYVMGTRIIINPADGGYQDIPFKPETFHYLPAGVAAITMERTNYGRI